MEFFLAIEAVTGERNRDEPLDGNRAAAFQASAVLARIQPCHRLVEKAESFFGTRDESSVSFNLLGRVRRIDLIGRPWVGLLTLIASEVDNPPTGFILQPGEHFSKRVTTFIVVCL